MLYTFKAVSLLRGSISRNYLVSLTQKRFIKLEPIPVSGGTIGETFEQKNERLNRPLSPHLSIYKPQLTSMLSISHRFCGIALVGYCMAFGLMTRYCHTEDVVELIKSFDLSSSTLIAAKAIFMYPFTFHAFNGFRHLVWDVGFGLSNKGVIISGYAVIVLSLLASVYIAYL